MNRFPAALKILLAVAALFYLVFILRTSFDVHGQRYFTLVDDAMISMRYARNLAQGQGLLWNPGQPPVEGISNLGWTLAMALIHLLPFSSARISLVVMLVAALLLLANIVVIFKIVRALDPTAELAPLIAATMTAFYFPLVFWTLRGLEVGALALTIGLALLLTLRLAHDPRPVSARWLTLVLVVAVLIRMDAILQVGLLLIYAGLTVGAAPRQRFGFVPFSRSAPPPGTVQRDMPGGESHGNRFFVIGLPIFVTVLTLLAILLIQRLYYGDFLPNTYYLKVNGVSAWERVRVGLLSLNDYASRDFLMPMVLALIGLAAFKELRTRESPLFFGLFAVQIGYSVWVGGDYAEELVDAANRFIVQGMPALFVLFALAMDRFLRHRARAAFQAALAVAIGLGALLVVSGEPWSKWAISNAPMLRTDIQRTKLGLHIQAHTDPRAVIAVHAAGQIPYFADRTSIDLLGKNDPVIAKGPPATGFAPGHNKWNYEYSILQLKPDVIADNFNRFPAFIDSVPQYQRLSSGIYVRVDSSLVDVDGLSADYK
ncbi:MAG TPA: hypothetical protein VGJ22_09205 [Anaerolineales bacterium]|jgi:hypothetical protein